MQAFLSYSHINEDEAKTLYERLEGEGDISVTWDAIDLPPYASPKSFMDSVREHDAVVHLISLPFLEFRNCMRELVAFMKDDTDRNHYSERAVPIIIDDATSGLNLFDITGQLQLVNYWMGQKSELKKTQLKDKFGAAIDELRSELTVRRDIAEHIVRFMRTVTDNIYAASYQSQATKNFADVIQRLRSIGTEVHERGGSPETDSAQAGRPARRLTHRLWRSNRDDGDLSEEATVATAERARAREPSPEENALIQLRDSIVIPSHSDPERPEFPPFSPRFPATPAKTLRIPELDREVVVKDESHNFTGSHKDRMAWEIVVYYRSLIEDLLAPHSKTLTLPSASIISNGSAAIAIQLMLRCHGLPGLKVLVDEKTDERIVERLLGVGCEVFAHDLSERELDSSDVLALTENPTGFDVTARNLVDPTRRTYYDWLAYEIFNCGAKHIFIPVGTGDLFVNVLTVLRDELMGVANDRLARWRHLEDRGTRIDGATSKDWKTKMDKLYATHRPTLDEARRVVSEVREAGHCGTNTDVYNVKETIVGSALSLAKANGIRCDESGIAGLSLLLQKAGELKIAEDEKILVVNTGWMSLAQ